MLLDTGFRPSEHGFGFANTWHDLLFGLVPSRGRCGGMVFAALDAFAHDRRLGPDASSATLPGQGAEIEHAIWRRQVDSVAMRLGSNMWRFVRFTYLPTSSRAGIALASRRELLPLFDALRSGRPVPLGLVSAIGPARLATNHQVLAYAADFAEDMASIRIYDPNYPRRDDVFLEVPLDRAQPIVERTGARRKVWRGFFVEHYSPKP